MASKQPFKLLDLKQKFVNLSIRVGKLIRQKVLFQSRNALILRDFHAGTETEHFAEKLKANLQKTWEIHELNVENLASLRSVSDIEARFGNRKYDAIIVPPLCNRKLKGFSSINQEEFACDLVRYQNQLLSNILAYRMAHKFLCKGGILIFSNSESDLPATERKDEPVQVMQPALKNILDAQVSYLGVTVGDREYTDLNSWSVVGLSEEFVGGKHEGFVVKTYGDWADGRNLPIPGSFAVFRAENDKASPFVKYL